MQLTITMLIAEIWTTQTINKHIRKAPTDKGSPPTLRKQHMTTYTTINKHKLTNQKQTYAKRHLGPQRSRQVHRFTYIYKPNKINSPYCGGFPAFRNNSIILAITHSFKNSLKVTLFESILTKSPNSQFE